MPLDIKNIEVPDGSNFEYNDRVVMAAKINAVNNASPGVISSVAVNTAGQYGSLPVIGTSGNGSGATLVAHMKAVAATIQAAGTGYAPGDVATLTGGTETTNIALTCDSTKLVSIAANAAGTGYAPLDTITTAGGTASVHAILSVASTQLVSAVVVAPGSGYAINDTITLAGGTHSVAALLNVTHVQLVSAAKNAGGSGYAPGDTITLSGGTGTPAVVTIDTAPGGVMGTFHITTPGNYTVEATTFTQASSSGSGTGATFQTALYGALTTTINTAGVYTANAASFTQSASSGSGTGATFNTTVYGVHAVTIANAGVYTTNASSFTQGSTSGSGTSATFQTALYGVNAMHISVAGSYTVLPANPVSEGSNTGSGTGATYNITGWGVDTVTVSAGGSGYDNVSAVTFTGGSPVIAAATTITLGSQTGNAVTVPIAFSPSANLPPHYGVMVNPGQNCFWYADNATKTATGFNVVLTPKDGSSTIAAGNIDVIVIG